MRAPLALIALAAPLALAGCGDPAPSYVDQAWVRLSPNKDTPSAGYFVAHGGDAGVQLRGVMTDYALKVEMHESVGKDGMMSMQPIESVDVPAKGTVAFAPGGKHLMIWGINGAAVRAGKLPMAFVFTNNNNERILFDMVIKPAESAAISNPPAPNGARGPSSPPPLSDSDLNAAR